MYPPAHLLELDLIVKLSPTSDESITGPGRRYEPTTSTPQSTCLGNYLSQRIYFLSSGGCRAVSEARDLRCHHGGSFFGDFWEWSISEMLYTAGRKGIPPGFHGLGILYSLLGEAKLDMALIVHSYVVLESSDASSGALTCCSNRGFPRCFDWCFTWLRALEPHFGL